MKKTVSFVLAILMVFSVISLCACSKEEEKKTVQETDAPEVVIDTKDKEDQSSQYTAQIKDLGGHEFKFITLSSTAAHLAANEVYAAELNGETINDAVFKRNSSLEKTYNCKIIEEKSTTPSTSTKTLLTAGEYACDFIYDSVPNEYKLTSADLLADLSSLDNIDMQKKWWDQNFAKALAIQGKVFYGVGDAGTMDDRSTWVLAFNKTRLEKVGLELPYTLVSENKWTIAKMYEYMQKTAEDSDGDGAMTLNKDFMGYVGERFNSWAHVAACGATVCSFNDNGSFSLDDTLNDSFIKAWGEVKTIMTSPITCVTDSATAFKNGKCEFYGINSATVAVSLALSNVEYGVIPFPMLNEQQGKYYSTVSSSWYGAYCIPKTCEEAEDAEKNGFSDGIEQAAYFLEAYAYESMNTLTIAFYDQVLMRQTAQDPESRKMIEMALENKIYDPAMFFGWGNITRTLYACTNEVEKGAIGNDSIWDTVTSAYQSVLPTARKAMDAYINYLDNIA